MVEMDRELLATTLLLSERQTSCLVWNRAILSNGYKRCSNPWLVGTFFSPGLAVDESRASG
jgi:hypothetical protein